MKDLRDSSSIGISVGDIYPKSYLKLRYETYLMKFFISFRSPGCGKKLTRLKSILGLFQKSCGHTKKGYFRAI